MNLSEQESIDKQQNEQEHCLNLDEQVDTAYPGPDNFIDSDREEEVEEQNPPGSMNDEESSDNEQEAGKPSAHRLQYEHFLKEMEKLPDSESKLQCAIDFMEVSLAQGGTPHFKNFWEARNLCLQLFKETIAPAIRMILWAKYNDLSKEARRLKDILDEQSAFAVEQIEIAVKALETDIANFDEHVKKVLKVDFEIKSMALEASLPFYEKLQKELNLLNTQAARINAMRKELIRTEMRVRQKNKFFQRLSAAGDKVFPKRKELIKEISQRFITDVDAFIAVHFNKEDFDDSLFALREEIKILQNIAKVLTLNTHSFTHTRMRLSECWDKIKNEDKERKKERSLQKTVFKQNFDESLQKLQEFKQKFETEGLSLIEATKELDNVISQIRNLEYSREEQRSLKTQVQGFRKTILQKMQEHENARMSQDQEREKQRRQKITEIKQQAEELLKNKDVLDADNLESQRDALINLANTSHMSKAEKLEVERQLKPLRDIISEKRESSLLALSDDDRQSLLQLKEVLKQRKERRQEIKAQIDALRKLSGASGLDFEQAMNVNAQTAAEKERLEKINQGIQEIEQKIAQLSKR